MKVEHLWVIALAMFIPVFLPAQRAYIPNDGCDKVSVIDLTTHTVIDSIVVGSHPQGVCVSPDGSSIYVTNNWSNCQLPLLLASY